MNMRKECWVCWYNMSLARYGLDASGKWILKGSVETKRDGVGIQPLFLARDPGSPVHAVFTSEGPYAPGVYRIRIDAGEEPQQYFRLETRLTTPRGIATSDDGYVFVADNVLTSDHPGSCKGIVVIDPAGRFVQKIVIDANKEGNVLPVTAYRGEVYFGTDQSLYRIERQSNGFGAVKLASLASLKDSRSRGIVGFKNDLWIICGDGWGGNSILCRYDLKKHALAPDVKDLSHRYSGICVAFGALQFTAFFSGSAGDVGGLFSRRLGSTDKGETSTVPGDSQNSRENPLGIIAV